jgi:hypothetical protein
MFFESQSLAVACKCGTSLRFFFHKRPPDCESQKHRNPHTSCTQTHTKPTNIRTGFLTQKMVPVFGPKVPLPGVAAMVTLPIKCLAHSTPVILAARPIPHLVLLAANCIFRETDRQAEVSSVLGQGIDSSGVSRVASELHFGRTTWP